MIYCLGDGGARFAETFSATMLTNAINLVVIQSAIALMDCTRTIRALALVNLVNHSAFECA